MNQILLKPLVQFKSHWQWLFVLGLFNSLILLIGFSLLSFGLADYAMWLNFFDYCKCSPAPGLPFSKYVFPDAVKVSAFVSLFQVFVSFCLLEAAYLTWKSHRFSTFSFAPVGINWFVRAVMKNLAGIFAILSCFAHPDYKIMYVGFIFLCCALIIWCQTGQYQGYSYDLLNGDKFWTEKTVHYLYQIAIIYAVIFGLLSGLIWLPLILFFALFAFPAIPIVIFFLGFMIYRYFDSQKIK